MNTVADVAVRRRHLRLKTLWIGVIASNDKFGPVQNKLLNQLNPALGQSRFACGKLNDFSATNSQNGVRSFGNINEQPSMKRLYERCAFQGAADERPANVKPSDHLTSTQVAKLDET